MLHMNIHLITKYYFKINVLFHFKQIDHQFIYYNLIIFIAKYQQEITQQVYGYYAQHLTIKSPSQNLWAKNDSRNFAY